MTLPLWLSFFGLTLQPCLCGLSWTIASIVWSCLCGLACVARFCGLAFVALLLWPCFCGLAFVALPLWPFIYGLAFVALYLWPFICDNFLWPYPIHFLAFLCNLVLCGICGIAIVALPLWHCLCGIAFVTSPCSFSESHIR